MARETLARIEKQQRGTRPTRILQLANALLIAPSMLTGSSHSDYFVDGPFRTCTDWAALRPIRAFVPIARTRRVYGRCRIMASPGGTTVGGVVLSSTIRSLMPTKNGCWDRLTGPPRAP
jgi:hypothetical protein